MSDLSDADTYRYIEQVTSSDEISPSLCESLKKLIARYNVEKLSTSCDPVVEEAEQERSSRDSRQNSESSLKEGVESLFKNKIKEVCDKQKGVSWFKTPISVAMEKGLKEIAKRTSDSEVCKYLEQGARIKNSDLR